MNTEQIIKALECLSKPNSSPDDRAKCYFMWKEPSCLNCHHEVAKNALALIKEQQAEIEEYKKLADLNEQDNKDTCELLFKEEEKCNELQAHNENLKKENKYLRERLAEEMEHKEDMKCGEWVLKDLNNKLYESKKAPHCSVCNYMSFIRHDYCPNCGAKMKGK